MSVPLSRAARRQLERAAAEVDKVTQADARFFERFPERTYRVRRMSRAEIESAEAIYGATLIVADPESAAFTLVKQLAPGVRLRVFLPGPADEDGSDLTDGQCRFLFERHAERHPSVRRQEAMLRDAVCSSAEGGR